MGVSNKSWQVYLAGKMDGLTFEEMNTWRQDAKTKIQIAADTAGYRCTIINPCDYYNQSPRARRAEIPLWRGKRPLAHP